MTSARWITPRPRAADGCAIRRPTPRRSAQGSRPAWRCRSTAGVPAELGQLLPYAGPLLSAVGRRAAATGRRWLLVGSVPLDVLQADAAAPAVTRGDRRTRPHEALRRRSPPSTPSISPSNAASCSGSSGPNGAGKTTTIRMALGLILPDRRRGRPARRDGSHRSCSAANAWAHWSRSPRSGSTCRAARTWSTSRARAATPWTRARGWHGSTTCSEPVGLTDGRRQAREGLQPGDAAAPGHRRSRCWARPSSWCSTSPRTGSIPAACGRCGCCCAASPTRAPRSSSRATCSPRSRRCATAWG